MPLKVNIDNQLTAAFGEQLRARDSLAADIKDLLKEIPVGHAFKTKSHVVVFTMVYSDCEVVGEEARQLGAQAGILVDGVLVCDCDMSHWDEAGQSLLRRRGPLRLDPHFGETVSLASAETLRSLAAELPEAVVAWMEELKQDAAASEAATGAMAAAVALMVTES